MTTKEKQTEFIKTYLKPILKNFEYKTSSNTWWKNKGEFFIVINLQNSQWNTKEELSFCFNIGIALTNLLKDSKKAGYDDILTFAREGVYLTEERKQSKYRKDSWLGYVMRNETDLNDFIEELKIDFESHIIPTLEAFQNLDDCLRFYEKNSKTMGSLRYRLNELNEKE